MKSILSLLLITSLNSFAQNPLIEWQNTIGANKDEQLKHFSKTAEAGYLLAGQTSANISGDKTEDSYGLIDYWLVILNADGEVSQDITYGGNSFDELSSACQASDGAYYMLGYSQSDMSSLKAEDRIGFRDYWLVKVNGFGELIWENTIGGTDDEWSTDMKPTDDGGCIIGGYSRSNASGDKSEDSFGGSYDYWVIKLDAEGEIEWENTIGGNRDDYLQSIVVDSDGGYLLGGSSNSDISGDKTEDAIMESNDYWLVKLNASGVIEWEKTLGGESSDRLNAIIQTTDGGYIAGGESWSNASGDKTEDPVGALATDYWVIKINEDGATEWDKTLGGTDFETLTSILETADGDIVVGGESNSNISGNKTSNSFGDFDYWIVKLTATGTIVWDESFGGSKRDRLISILEWEPGELALGGESNSGITGDKTEDVLGGDDLSARDFWVLKLKPVVTEIEEHSNNSSVNIYPNPTNDILHIQSNENTIIEVHSLSGELLIQSNNPSTLNLNDLTQGTYILTVFDNNHVMIDKKRIVKL